MNLDWGGLDDGEGQSEGCKGDVGGDPGRFFDGFPMILVPKKVVWSKPVESCGFDMTLPGISEPSCTPNSDRKGRGMPVCDI